MNPWLKVLSRWMLYWLLAGMGERAWSALQPVGSASNSVVDSKAVRPVAAANSVADGGRYVLVTVTSPGLCEGMMDGTPQLFRLDMESGAMELVSRAESGGPGNGVSGKGEMSADGRRVVFESRASDLVDADTNGMADVFERDLVAGTTRLVSVGAGGAQRAKNSWYGFANPQGRWVAYAQVEGGSGVRWQFLRDLEAGEDWPEGAQLIRGGGPCQFSASGAKLAVAYGGPFRGLWRGVVQVDFEAKTFGWVVEESGLNGFGPPALSADGRLLAWCRIMRGSVYYTNRMEVYDTATGGVEPVTSSLMTNVSGVNEYAQHIRPAWSPEGHWLVLGLPEHPAGTTNILTQLHLWNRETAELVPITTAAEGGGMGSGNSLNPMVGPEAAHVVFWSDATNLVAGGVSAGRRVYRWERATGLVTELFAGLDAAGGLPPVGAWDGGQVVAAAARADGAVVVQVVNLSTGDLKERVFEPAIKQGVTRPGEMWRGGCLASADGRWVATMASAGDGGPVQIYLVDRESGERRLVSRGVDGEPAAGNCWLGGMSLDGNRLMFLSGATNLVAGKMGVWTEACVYSRTADALLPGATGWRGTNTAAVESNATMSPDGRWLVVESDQVRLVEVESGTSWELGVSEYSVLAAFAADGKRLELDVMNSMLKRRLTVYDVEALVAGQPGTLLSTNVPLGKWSALSPDGARLAYVYHAGARYDLAVVDAVTGAVMFTRPGAISAARGGCSFSANSRWLVWEEGVRMPQVWRADLGTGEAGMVSVGSDGITPGDGVSLLPGVSADGRWVVFASTARNLVNVAGPAGVKQVYLRDTALGRTFRVSRSSDGGAGTGGSTRPWFSADGRQLFLVSGAANLVAGDLNGMSDVLTVALVDAGELVLLVQRLWPNAVSLSWSGKAGLKCRVQYKDSLDARWNTYPGVFGADDSLEMDTGWEAMYFRLVEVGP